MVMMQPLDTYFWVNSPVSFQSYRTPPYDFDPRAAGRAGGAIVGARGGAEARGGGGGGGAGTADAAIGGGETVLMCGCITLCQSLLLPELNAGGGAGAWA